MSDLIDRQAAISAICNACGKIDCDKMDKCEKLQLPPASCSEFPNNSDTIQPDNGLQKLADEIASFKRCVKSENSDYLTGYLSALSVVEGMIADMRREVTP